MTDYPVVNIEGSEEWRGYEVGEELDEKFPDQDGIDFAMAYGYNDHGPLREAGAAITGLLMAQQGENDDGEWVWVVSLSNGETWWMSGSCDYTGWDCRSGNEWVKA